MKSHRKHHGVGLCAMALAVALLQACGGASNTASNNSGGITPTVNGTVTGFGSVMLDGLEYEDAYAKVAHENADGTLTNDVLQMGQRVRMSHDGTGKASQVLIDAAVIGTVSKVDSNSLQVAGQVVTINTDSAQGPITVFGGGYTDLSTVAVNDLVQVHGTPVYDSVTKSYKVQATRIQKDTGEARVQVNGKITDYSANSTSASFTLNGLQVTTSSNTAVRPSGTALANGLQVTAYGKTLSGNVLSATNIRVNRDQNSGNTAMQAQLSGLVSNYNASAGTLELLGSVVNLGTATIKPTGASLANKAYVTLKGTVAADGSITATEINVRSADTSSDLAKVQLIGVISDFVDTAHFMVRGVPVDASGIDFATACKGATVANDLPIQVKATQQAGTAVVKATSVTCMLPPSSAPLIRPVDGTVASVDAANKTFTLTQGSTTQSVQWTDTTTFVGVTADSLNGKTLHVDGYTTGTTFVARVIRLDDDSNAGTSAPELDDKQFRRPRQSGEQAPGWQRYRPR